MSPLPGERVSHYEIVEKLGAGGMGEVYVGQDTRLGRTVALKFLPEDWSGQPQALERFRREARAASSLNHPNICTIHDIGDHEGHPFIVMELMKGESLLARLRRGPLPSDEAARLAAQIAAGLQAAHETGIVHRDIKPGNIFITSHDQAKILDFGLAKQSRADSGPSAATDISSLDTETVDDLTRAGTTVGTLAYMSPEQVRGDAADARSDLFSLGVVIYEMVTGHRAFGGKTPALVSDAILNRAPDPASRKVSEVPVELERILDKALEKDRQLRYQSAADLQADLKRLRRDSSGTSPARGSSEPMEAASDRGPAVSDAALAAGIMKRHRAVFVAGFFLLASILAAAAWYLRHPSGPPDVEQGVIDSLAVLPIENTGGSEEDAYLVDGVTEELIASLSAVPGLKVMARSTVFRFKEPGIDPMAAGKQLGVGAVVTGRIRRSGEDLILSAELVNVADGVQLWGGRFDRNVSDLHRTKEEIASAVARTLRPDSRNSGQALLPEHPAGSGKAYQLYLKARFHWNRRSPDDVRQAMAYFQRAVDEDPTFALAWSGISDCYNIMSQGMIGRAYSDISRREAISKALEASRQALKLDDSLAEAHVSLAAAEWMRWNWEVGEREIRTGLELNPGYATGRQWLAEYLSQMGRVDEAIAEGRKALELDPLSAPVTSALADIYLRAGQPQDAIDLARDAMELQESFAGPHMVTFGALLALEKEDDAALYWLDRMMPAVGTPPELIERMRNANEESGIAGIWQVALDLSSRGAERGNESWITVAICYVHLGRFDESFAALERAYDARDPGLGRIYTNPSLAPVLLDPRFEDLLMRINFPGEVLEKLRERRAAAPAA